MNSYTYEDLKIGQSENFSVTVTEEMMEAFRGITGDYNPLHTDANYAREKGYSS